MTDALKKEIILSRTGFFNDEEVIETIYFGGGTPSLLTTRELEELSYTIRNNYPVSSTAEITLEANPDDISAETLAEWKSAGINRLSIGIQSFKEADLQWMNRAHNAAEALHCIELAKAAGFQNFSIDLIYGTPGLTDEEWENNVQTIIALGVPHIACYALTVEPGTALKKMIDVKKKVDVNSDDQARQFLLLMKWMAAAGYEHYEISNFARPGYRSRHNSSYWKAARYLGIGPSAHSFTGTSRKWNISNNSLYIQSIKNNLIPFEEEILTETQQLNEYIMTSLRTIEGLDLKFIEERFSLKEKQRIEAESKIYLVRGMMIKTDKKFILTNEGKLFADGIAANLFAISILK